MLDATGHETRSQAEQQIGQDGAQNGSLDDNDIGVVRGCLEQHHEQDDFDYGAKSGFEDNGEGLLGHLAGEFLASESQQIGGRQHGNVVGDEDGQMPFWASEMLENV